MELEKLKRLFSLCDAFHAAVDTAPEKNDPVISAHTDMTAQTKALELKCVSASIAAMEAFRLASIDHRNEAAAKTGYTKTIEICDALAEMMLLVAPDQRVSEFVPDAFKNPQDAADLESLGAHTLAKLCRI